MARIIKHWELLSLSDPSELGPGNETVVESVEYDGDIAPPTDSEISPQSSSESRPESGSESGSKMAPAQDAEKTENGRVGPHPSFIHVAKPYMLEQDIQNYMAETGVTQAKEDNIRLLGVAWIDTVRKALQL